MTYQTEIDISVSKLLGFETVANFLRVSVSENLVSEKKSQFWFQRIWSWNKSIGFGQNFGIVIQWPWSTWSWSPWSVSLTRSARTPRPRAECASGASPQTAPCSFFSGKCLWFRRNHWNLVFYLLSMAGCSCIEWIGWYKACDIW